MLCCSYQKVIDETKAFVRIVYPVQALFVVSHIERERVGVAMRRAVLTKSAFFCGGGALNYLQQIICSNVVIIADNKSESDIKIAEKIEEIVKAKKVDVSIYREMNAKPDITELLTGLAFI